MLSGDNGAKVILRLRRHGLVSSALALRTEVRRASLHHDPTDRRTAPRAGLTGATVSVKGVRKIPCLAIHVHVLRIETRSALCKRLRKHLTKMRKNLSGFPCAQGVRPSLRVKPCAPQRLVSVNVSHPAQQGLIKDRLLHRCSAAAKTPHKCAIVERRIERISSNMGSLTGERCKVCAPPRRSPISGRHQPVKREGTEQTLIREIEPEFTMAWVFEPHPNPHVAVVGGIMRAEQQLSAHPQVREKRFGR